ncbi:hypothetical protein BKA80DRAFT_137305 [Phyllosticta citrichinensis]
MAPSTPSSLALSPSGSCWGSIPPEIVLEIVSCLDYDPETLRNLRRVDKRTYRIMRDYEHSVCKSFATGQLRLGILRSPDLLSPSCESDSPHPTIRSLIVLHSWWCCSGHLIPRPGGRLPSNSSRDGTSSHHQDQ